MTKTAYQIIVIRNKVTYGVDMIELLSENTCHYKLIQAKRKLVTTKEAMIKKGWVEESKNKLVLRKPDKVIVDTYCLIPFHKIRNH